MFEMDQRGVEKEVCDLGEMMFFQDVYSEILFMADL
jgi:hypothetical protein